MSDIDGLIAKLKSDEFARGFVRGVEGDARDWSERIAELEAQVEKLDAEVRAWREREALAGFDGKSVVLSG